jgi:hypothetical protein
VCVPIVPFALHGRWRTCADARRSRHEPGDRRTVVVEGVTVMLARILVGHLMDCFFALAWR